MRSTISAQHPTVVPHVYEGASSCGVEADRRKRVEATGAWVSLVVIVPTFLAGFSGEDFGTRNQLVSGVGREILLLQQFRRPILLRVVIHYGFPFPHELFITFDAQILARETRVAVYLGLNYVQRLFFGFEESCIDLVRVLVGVSRHMRCFGRLRRLPPHSQVWWLQWYDGGNCQQGNRPEFS